MPSKFEMLAELAKKGISLTKGSPATGRVQALSSKLSDPARTQVLPMPNRWFLSPEKFPHVQPLVEKVLKENNMKREDFFSGAFVDPKTGKILDFNVMKDVGVVIDPVTNRPKMSGLESGVGSFLDIPETMGPQTKSNLVRKGLFKSVGGDPLLNDINFLATVERSGAGHQYGLGTEYATPTEMLNTMTGDNPTLRPHSRGDLFGVGDVVGQIVTPQGKPTDVYESLLIAPKGSDVEGVRLHKKAVGGKVSQDAMHMAVMNQKVQRKGGGGALKTAKELWDIAKGTRSKAAQEAAGLYHPIGGGVKLSKPVPFMEFKTIEDPTIKMAQRRIISPEAMQGGIAMPLVGDRAAAGKILTDVGGKRLTVPVTLEGGGEYMLTHASDDPNVSAAWASGKDVVSGLSKNASFLGESGRPVYGVNVIGSATNVDYNTMVTDAVLGQFDPSSLTKKAKKEFTKELRNYVPDPKKPHIIPGKNFVGLDDVDAMREQLMAPNAGELRKAFVNRMGTAKFRDMGFPDVAEARLATTEPSLVDSPLGMAGFTIAKLDPTGKIIETPIRKHGTYSDALGGKYEGSLESLVPYKKFFPTFDLYRRSFGANPSSDYRAFSLSPISQELDQQWLDSVMKYMGKDKPSVSEFKDGGIAHMKDGDLVEDLIKEAKSKQEAPVDQFAPKPILRSGQSSKAQKTIEEMRAEVEANRRAADILRQDIKGIEPREGTPYAGRSTIFPEGIMRDVAESAYRDIGPSIIPAERQWKPSVTVGRQPSYVSPANVGTALMEAGSALDLPSQLAGEAAFRSTGSPLLATAAAYGPGMIGPEGYVKGSKALANEAAYRIYQAIDRGEGALAPMLAGVAPKKMIPAWHGSPHDIPMGRSMLMEKIGTGEGAQAYGHGLYAAETRDVGKSYQPRSPKYEENLLRKYNQAKRSSDYPTMEILEDAMLHRTADEILEKYSQGEYSKQHINAAKQFANWYKKNPPEVGGLYKLELSHPDPAKEKATPLSPNDFLHWDKPLSQQPESVRKIAQEHGVKDMVNIAEDPQNGFLMSPSLGADVYENLVNKLGKEGASLALNKIGIPGIRYLDAGSQIGRAHV